MKRFISYLMATTLVLLLAGCNNQPEWEVTGISIKKSITLTEGESQTLKVRYTPEEAAEKAPAIQWESSSTKIVKVNEQGKVTGVKQGVATITAYCGKLSAECKVTVEKSTAPTLSVYPSKINSTDAGGEFELEINTTIDWTAKASESWIQLSANSGLGEKKIKVSIPANETFEEMNGSILVKAGSEEETIPVVLAARTPQSLSVNPAKLEFPAEGGTLNAKVLTTIAWTATVSEDWATINPTSGEGDTEIEVTASANSSITDIEQKIELDNGEKKEYLTIVVKGRDPKPITIAPSSISVMAMGETKNITVSSELDWDVINSCSWITVSDKTSNSINIIVAEYTASRGNDMQAQLTFSNGEQEAVLEVTQEAPTLTVDKNNINISDDGGDEIISITSSLKWEASVNATWAHLSSTKGTGNGKITLYVDAADSKSITTCQVTITCAGITRTINVTRQGYDPYAFSIAKGKKVRLAKGNLQYQARTGRWRFAPNQYTTIGDDNKNASSIHSGWIDLFCWGATGLNGIMPYETSTSVTGLGNLTGDNDWGANVIGSDPAGTWRSLTRDEWRYIIGSGVSTLYRKNSYDLCAVGTVMGVHGLIILPDHWEQPSGTTFKGGAEDLTTNTITNWTIWENAGAIFLPFGAHKDQSGNLHEYDRGYYWTATFSGDDNARYLTLLAASSTNFYSVGSRKRSLMVRLARDL